VGHDLHDAPGRQRRCAQRDHRYRIRPNLGLSRPRQHPARVLRPPRPLWAAGL